MATGPEKWLAFQAWGLEFKPKNPPERPAVVACTCWEVLRRQRQWIPHTAHWPTRLLIQWFPSQWETLSKEKEGKKERERQTHRERENKRGRKGEREGRGKEEREGRKEGGMEGGRNGGKEEAVVWIVGGGWLVRNETKNCSLVPHTFANTCTST